MTEEPMQRSKLTMKKTRHIDHAQMMFIRPGDFNTQNVVRETLLQVLNVLVVRARQPHAFRGLTALITNLQVLGVAYTSSRTQANLVPLSSSAAICISNFDSRSFWSSSSTLEGPGTMEALTAGFSPGVRCRTICVAKRVHRSEAIGNERPVRPSRSDDFPLDWSPTTII